jgi:hypothetical protein
LGLGKMLVNIKVQNEHYFCQVKHSRNATPEFVVVLAFTKIVLHRGLQNYSPCPQYTKV